MRIRTCFQNHATCTGEDYHKYERRYIVCSHILEHADRSPRWKEKRERTICEKVPDVQDCAKEYTD